MTNAIQDWIERVSKIPVDESGEEPDVCIVEVRIDEGLRLNETKKYVFFPFLLANVAWWHCW